MTISRSSASRGCRRRLLAACMFCLLSGLGFSQISIRIDNSYFDWQAVRPLLSLSEDSEPVETLRERGGWGFAMDVGDALYWGRGGTRLRGIKAVLDRDNLYLFIESHTNFAYELSIFLYLHAGRGTGDVNRHTLEIMPGRINREGAVLIWTRGSGDPRLTGELESGSFMLECRIPLKELPADLAAETVFIDVSTCYHEEASGSFEEFFLATIPEDEVDGLFGRSGDDA